MTQVDGTRPLIRILFPYVGGDLIGGSHVSSLTLAARLDRDRFAPQILLHRESGQLGELVREMGLGCDVLTDVSIMAPAYSRTAHDTRAPGYLARSVWRMAAELRRRRIDIVHTNDGRMHVNWSPAARIAGARHLWHHREDPKTRGANLIAPYLADRLLSVSDFAVPKRAKASMGNRISVVRSPFEFQFEPPDRPACRAALCKEIGVTHPDAILIGYVGGLISRKRPDVFVRILKATQDAMPDNTVFGVMFGEVDRPGSTIGADIVSLSEDLGVSDKLRLMGHRSPIAGPMSALDALIVPALDEPFGRTLIEAMDLGVPVIASRHGGNIEAIGDGVTGFLVSPDDLGAYASRVRKLVSDPALRARLTEAARTDVRLRFAIERSVGGVERVYEGMMQDPPRFGSNFFRRRVPTPISVRSGDLH